MVSDHPPTSHQRLLPAGPGAGGLGTQNCSGPVSAAELPVRWGDNEEIDDHKMGGGDVRGWAAPMTFLRIREGFLEEELRSYGSGRASWRRSCPGPGQKDEWESAR